MLKNKKGVISIDIKKIIKGKRNLLVGGVLIVATIALTSCSDADIQIRTYDKENDDTSQKISNVVDYAINEFTSENSSSKTSNDTTTNNTESTGNNGTTKTASEEEIKQAFLAKIKEADDDNEEKLQDYRIDKVEIISDSEKKSILEFDGGVYYKETDTLAYVTYSVKPQDINSGYWLAGNGVIDGEWITGKSAVVCMRNGEIVASGTGW